MSTKDEFIDDEQLKVVGDLADGGYLGATCSATRQLVREVKHHRAALAADEERVRSVVRLAVESGYGFAVDNAEISEHDGWHRTAPMIEWPLTSKIEEHFDAIAGSAAKQLASAASPDRLAIVEAFCGGASYMADHTETSDGGAAGVHIAWADGVETAAEAWATRVGAEHRITHESCTDLVRTPQRCDECDPSFTTCFSNPERCVKRPPTSADAASAVMATMERERDSAIELAARINRYRNELQTEAATMRPLVDLAIRIREQRYTIRTNLHREDRALFDELSAAVDVYRKAVK